jgi:hypothetical protein
MRKAIITFGVGYQFEDIRYFLESCKKYCAEADIYMYVGKNYKQLKKDCLKFENLHLIQYEESVVPKVIAKVFSFVPGIQICNNPPKASFKQLAAEAPLTNYCNASTSVYG